MWGGSVSAGGGGGRQRAAETAAWRAGGLQVRDVCGRGYGGPALRRGGGGDAAVWERAGSRRRRLFPPFALRRAACGGEQGLWWGRVRGTGFRRWRWESWRGGWVDGYMDRWIDTFQVAQRSSR